jgi:hypothetical protein
LRGKKRLWPRYRPLPVAGGEKGNTVSGILRREKSNYYKGGLKMNRFCLVFAVCVFAFALTGCSNPSSVDGSAPSITDTKISSTYNISNPTFVTTLSVNQTYYSFIYATDRDLDISQCIITQTNGTQTIGPDTIPVTGQTAVSAVFVGSFTPKYTGTWTATLYLLDAKGNKSNTKSISVTVN